MAKVEILMATYNGEKYVREQIDSILSQSFEDFHITVSDDYSTDSTYSILKSYEEMTPAKIKVIRPPNRFGNARDHFFYLLKIIDADYYFFSDQDDVWFGDKLVLFLDAFKEAESSYGNDFPLLVFSDQTPTDSQLNPLSESLMEYQKQNSNIKNYKELIFQNVVTGGAMALSRKLRDLSLLCTDTTKTIMHDHWIAIVAALFGKCIYLNCSTSYYRQHGGNEVGAKNVRQLGYIIRKISHLKKLKEKIQNDKKQAGLVYSTYEKKLTKEDSEFLLTYSKERSGVKFYFKNRKYFYGTFRFVGKMILG